MGAAKYHIACFTCKHCGAAFSAGEKKGPYPRDGELYCYDHAKALMK